MFSSFTLPPSSVSHNLMKQLEMLACHGLDREFLLDTAACGAAHVDSSIEIVPLIDDHASECPGIVGGCQPAVREVDYEPAVAWDRRGDQRNRKRHGLQERDAHSLLTRW